MFIIKGKITSSLPPYFSKYPKVASLTSENSDTVILAMNLRHFAPHSGIPERLITDNMPFNRLTFKSGEVLTSSPHYQKSNGLVERNVQTVKQLLRKADEFKQSSLYWTSAFTLSGAWTDPQQNYSEQKAENKVSNLQEPPGTAG